MQIAHPMDLSTIRLKIDRKKYRSMADFDRDVMLMMHNCFTFNTDDSLVYSVSVLYVYVYSICMYFICIVWMYSVCRYL